MQCIPEDMSFSAQDEPCFVSADGQVKVSRDCDVRLRVVGIRNDANEIFCVGTIKDNYLGVLGGGGAEDNMV